MFLLNSRLSHFSATTIFQVVSLFPKLQDYFA